MRFSTITFNIIDKQKFSKSVFQIVHQNMERFVYFRGNFLQNQGELIAIPVLLELYSTVFVITPCSTLEEWQNYYYLLTILVPVYIYWIGAVETTR